MIEINYTDGETSKWHPQLKEWVEGRVSNSIMVGTYDAKAKATERNGRVLFELIIESNEKGKILLDIITREQEVDV